MDGRVYLVVTVGYIVYMVVTVGYSVSEVTTTNSTAECLVVKLLFTPYYHPSRTNSVLIVLHSNIL